MQDAAGRMQILIKDLLLLSRVTTQAQPLTPLDLSEVVQTVVSNLKVSIKRTGGQVEIGGLPVIDADAAPSQMRQLFQNRIGSALKFHRADLPPIVKVEAEQKASGRCHINLTNNGIGFDEKYTD